MDIKDIFEENGNWHKKGKDGKCEPFTMEDLKEIVEKAYRKGKKDEIEFQKRVGKKKGRVENKEFSCL